jgi:hypothetical protein
MYETTKEHELPITKIKGGKTNNAPTMNGNKTHCMGEVT